MTNTDKPYFVMLNTQNGGYTPLDCGDDNFELACFTTREEAEKAGANSVFGQWFGYEVFVRGGYA